MNVESHSVLIVDDDLSVYDFIKYQLDKINSHVIFAQNGPDALQLAEEILPDVIILDVMMPGMDGFEVCRRMRLNPILADVPIVMITALDDSQSNLLGFQAGADDFFTKPVDQVLLLTRLQNILRMNRMRKQIEERARFTEALEAKNLQLRELAKNLIELQEKERRFVAAELHDDLGQLLTGLKLMLEMSFSQSGDELQKTLDQAKNIVTDLSVRVRNLSLDLRPAMLDDFGLFAALEWLFERYTRQTNVRVIHNFSFMDKRRFPKSVETAAFRIIQESLTNVARYAGVNEVSVDVNENDNLVITISDLGKGFDPAASERKGFESVGISSMRERVGMLGGDFSITSSPGMGTTIKAVFILRKGFQNG